MDAYATLATDSQGGSHVSTMRKISHLPTHIAIIMDGNGRWAEQRGLPRLNGHKAGVDNIHRLVERLSQYQIRYVTLYGFSTENWSRPEDEVEGLLHLLEERIDKETVELHRNGVRIRHLGRFDRLPDHLQHAINRAVDLTKNNSRMLLGVAFDYGARGEILDAVRRLVAEGITPDNIDERSFNSYLYTTGLPDVDLVIRTGGELRISNFLLWQAAYSEYYFTKVLWPDFSERDIDRALLSYSRRQRRFGGV